MPFNGPYLDLQLPPRRRRSWWKITLLTLAVLVCAVAGLAAGVVWYFSLDLPPLDTLQEYQPSVVSRVYSDDRQVIGQYYVERRILAPLADIPQALIQAVIAVEDARFFEHPGLDVIGILRAVWTNLRRGGKVEGASTITQQLARSLFLSPERTYGRKFRELILAYKIELILSKEQILEMYLNQIYFGQGAYGVGAAAQTYFGKNLADLSLAESAFLAGLPKSPNNYSPFKNPERAKKRQEHVLARMEEAGFITETERQEAGAQLLSFRHPVAEQIAPYFIEYVRQQLMAKYGETMVYKGGLEVFTTLNVDMQKAAEQAVLKGLRELDKRQGWRGPIGTQDLALLAEQTPATPAQPLKEGDILQGVVTKVAKDHVLVLAGTTVGRLSFDDMAWARRRLRGRDPTKDVTELPTVKKLVKPGDVIEVAVKKVERDSVQFQLEQTPIVEGGLVAIDPRTGAIRAMVGGYDFARSEYNRAVLAHRQPGSAFKPIIYATALNEGLSPATVVLDAPVVYEQEDTEKIWKPENYEKRFYGLISLREALIHSRNLATVRLLDRIGVRTVIDFANTIGITSPLSHDLSLALGSSSVSLVEITSAYGVFANQGIRLEPYAIGMVQDASGQTLEQNLFGPRQVVSKETAYLITNMLEDVIQKGTGQQAKSIERPVAGKTGTTNDYTDAWFIGYTPNLVVGVWVGFDDLRSLGETESGAHAALPIWIEFTTEALEQLPVVPFEIPDDILFVRVDPETGLLASDQSDQGTVEIFTKGTEPTEPAPPRIDPTDFYKLDQFQDGTVGAVSAPR
ncbi:MAG: PBP1A family penicillin-binding protein [Nitrospirae bacterium]|nr:PBP1A family penicillin-binding protein [Nitrospirota bacterium]